MSAPDEPEGPPAKKQHGGRRVGSGRKSNEWYVARRAEELAILAAVQSQPPVQRPRRIAAHPPPPAQEPSQPIVASTPPREPPRPAQPAASTSHYEPPRSTQPVVSTSHPLQHVFQLDFESDTSETPLQTPIPQEPQTPTQESHRPTQPVASTSRHTEPFFQSSVPESSHGNIGPGDHTIDQHFNQLAEELRFRVQDHPNGDVPWGEPSGGDALFHVADDQPNAADAGDSEPPTLQTYLQQVKARIMKEMSTDGLPQCYKLGDLFDRHIQNSMVDTNGFTSGTLYHPDVLVWIPHLLAPTIILKCECRS
ncbi:hypothetical protein C8R45DRAFT_449876 [Mycena sanguinolenta]|nr:hypothetical protein C8R45DRAFT_449876 [Mycena sanguinolenta]